MPTVTKFIKSLRNANVLKVEETRNVYMGDNIESQIRRHNLNLYLEYMKTQKPKVLLVGEAPGYNGCGLTGIPFTSEYILANNRFFAHREFQFINEKPQKEMSATIVWECLEKYEFKPLIWNIFPFHPHQKGNYKSNRTPNRGELDFGREYLFDLVKIFSIQKIAAVGRKAQTELKGSDLSYENVRHPSRGGKAEFNIGIGKIMN